MEKNILASYIDHAVLDPQMTVEQLKEKIIIGVNYGCKSVCVNPSAIDIAKDCIQGSKTLLCVVCDFPFGCSHIESKLMQAQAIIDKGDIYEIDMVMNIGALKDKNYDLVRDDVKAVVEAANGTLVKVILETCLLTEDEIKKACELCVEAKADYVKTSTGFSTRGATIEDVQIMKAAVQGKAKVKAAGGVRTHEDMVKIVEAGADRIGTSAGCSLVEK